MAEYDVAMDAQVDWASFWNSDAGINMHRAMSQWWAKKRAEAGEKESDLLVEYEDDELTVCLASLLNGECYYWSRDMIDVVSIAAQSLPDTWSLQKSYIPGVSGFFYFSKELENHITALAWNITSTDEGDVETDHFPKAVGIHIPRPDGSIPDFNGLALITFVKNPEFPRPLPSRASLYVGETLREWKRKMVHEAIRINAEPKEVGGHYEVIRLFGTMLSFIDQKILLSSRYTVSRATRRRAEAANRQGESDVNVIRLRSVIHHAHKGDGEEVNWQCRWIVRGHWRDQWYPSLNTHKPKWITPYVKGPEEKPLKDPRRLFAVVR